MVDSTWEKILLLLRQKKLELPWQLHEIAARSAVKNTPPESASVGRATSSCSARPEHTDRPGRYPACS